MEDEQFNKLMAVNRETQEMQREQGKVQRQQGDTLSGFGRDLEGLSQENARQSDTLNGLTIGQAKLETTVDHLREGAKEDREADTKRSDRMEDKLGKVHDRVNDVPKLRGEFENHIDDDHAAQATANKAAIKAHTKDEHADLAVTTAAEFAKHDIDNNRHSGEAPGSGGAVKTGAVIGSGVVGGGGILWIIAKVIEAYTGG